MRRDQILKICLNFFLTDEVELKRKEENSWSFAANDFSEGEFEPTSFAIRFKNKEIADTFKKAIEDALAGNSSSEKQDGEADEKSQLVKKLLLPDNFFEYLKAQECSGCIGCQSDDFSFTTGTDFEFSKDNKTISLEPPKIKSRSKPRRQSVDKKVSFNISEEREASEVSKINQLFATGNVSEKANLFGGIKKSEAKSNIFATFNAENPTPPSTNIFGNSGSVFGAKPDFTTPTNSIFSSQLNTTPSETKPTESFGLFGNKTNFSFSSGENVFGSVNKENGEAGVKPFAAFSSTPAFGSTVFNNNSKPQEIPTGNIFGSATKSSFSFAEAAKELDKKDNSPSAVPDFLTKNNDTLGFATIAALANPEQTWGKPSGTSAGGFYGLTVKDDIFSKNMKGIADTSNNDDSTANDENYDPHYDPIIALPDEINVSTGEEEEEKLFGERAKLFRYDAKTKEWKERGKNFEERKSLNLYEQLEYDFHTSFSHILTIIYIINKITSFSLLINFLLLGIGEIKVLSHAGNGTYRLLLRREQIYKLVLNQLITTDLHMSPMNNSQKAFCWTGLNFTEGNNEAEQLAIRFKNEDLASNFKLKIDECIRQLESRDNLQPEND